MTDFAFPVLLADIGGTNARFQLVDRADGDTVEFEPVKTAQFETIEDAVRRIVLEAGHKPRTAILAAAGPITPHGLNLTNCDWCIEGNDFVRALGLERLVLFNDFDAQALALPCLTANDVVPLGNVALKPCEKTMGVIGPGTGLGVGTLARAGGRWVPVGGEGGHVDLGPHTEREFAIWPWLQKIDGRISAEQILCGDGLVNLYTALCRADGGEPIFRQADEISSAAMEEADPQAREALSIFCTCLGRVAGDLALTNMTKGGVFIGGGIAGHILPFLRESGIRTAFDDKAPHVKLLGAIGLHVVTRALPALVGLKEFARTPDAFLIDLQGRSWG